MHQSTIRPLFIPSTREHLLQSTPDLELAVTRLTEELQHYRFGYDIGHWFFTSKISRADVADFKKNTEVGFTQYKDKLENEQAIR